MMNNSDKKIETKLDAVTEDGAAVRTGWQDHDEALVAVAEAVGAFLNKPSIELPPLGNVVDGNALDQLLNSGRETADVALTFGYQELEITITQSEILIIDPVQAAGG